MLHLKYNFDFRELNLDIAPVERLMGYEPGKTDPLFMDTIRDVVREAHKHCAIRAELKTFDVVELRKEQQAISIGEELFQTGKIVTGQLRHSEDFALVICTAGQGITEWMKEEGKKGDSLKAYIIDLFGSEIVEAAMDRVQQDFRGKMEETGLKITNRYSPGYCGWNVDEQHKFFRFFENNYPGIRLSSSALMQPVKSVSCIIGIGREVSYNPYTCGLCDMLNCMYRERATSR